MRTGSRRRRAHATCVHRLGREAMVTPGGRSAAHGLYLIRGAQTRYPDTLAREWWRRW